MKIIYLIFISIVFKVNAIRNVEKYITTRRIGLDENSKEGIGNITSRQSGHISFEGENRPSNDRPNGAIKFEDDATQVNLVAFDNNYDLNPVNDNQLVFDEPSQQQDVTSLPQQEDLPRPQKKKRRRRRKPKRQNIPGQYGLLNGGPQNNANPYYGAGPIGPYQGQYPGPVGPYPVPNGPHQGSVGPYLEPVGPNGYPSGHPYQPSSRPPRRRKPASLAEDALTSVTRALGSIAQYDDYQCVPRLLCEVAGGKTPGAVSQTPSILPSFIDLQPLITLLAAFNGLSSSPLFVFGRAVFLGITSKGNTGTCRYAYPQCPTEPDQLVDYLNNHNGGFFRFFNGGIPQNYGQQGLQQFYSQLSGAPGYGAPQGSNQGPLPNAQNYGLYNGYGATQGSNLDPLPNGQNYGIFNGNGAPQSSNLGPPPNGQNYGLYVPVQNNGIQPQFNGFGAQNSGLYNPVPQYYPQGNYGFNYPYNKHANIDEIDSNKIEKRIQNNPSVYINTKEVNNNNNNVKLSFSSSNRVTKSLRFPEETKPVDNYISYNNYVRSGKGIQFPEAQSNRQYIEYYNYPPYPVLDENRFKLDADGYYVEADDPDGEDADTIYVLRGNGDPNNPEVIKLKPGQKVSDLTNL